MATVGSDRIAKHGDPNVFYVCFQHKLNFNFMLRGMFWNDAPGKHLHCLTTDVIKIETSHFLQLIGKSTAFELSIEAFKSA